MLLYFHTACPCLFSALCLISLSSALYISLDCSPFMLSFSLLADFRSSTRIFVASDSHGLVGFLLETHCSFCAFPHCDLELFAFISKSYESNVLAINVIRKHNKSNRTDLFCILLCFRERF